MARFALLLSFDWTSTEALSTCLAAVQLLIVTVVLFADL